MLWQTKDWTTYTSVTIYSFWTTVEHRYTLLQI